MKYITKKMIQGGGMTNLSISLVPSSPLWIQNYAIIFSYCIVVFLIFTKIITMIPIFGEYISCLIKKILSWALDFMEVTDC